MTSEHRTKSHELQPIDPDIIASFYRYDSIEKLASTIPHGSKILTIGPGTSTFSKDLAFLKFDIELINVDSNYADPSILLTAQEGAGLNVEFIAHTIEQLDDEFQESYFDKIYYFNDQLSEGEGVKEATKAMERLSKFMSPYSEFLLAPAGKAFEGHPSYKKEEGLLQIQKKPGTLRSNAQQADYPTSPTNLYDIDNWGDSLILSAEDAKKLKLIGGGILSTLAIGVVATIIKLRS